nr:DUF402 domain-containing protein [Candidatus Sigynarchaeota archaeon]
VLSRNISCPGTYVVLILENKIVFSKKITDPALKSELEEIASEHPARTKEKFGIIFRSACNDANMADVRADLDALVGRMSEVREKIRTAQKGLVIDPLGISQVSILFTKQSIDFLDTTRRQKVATLSNHHYWRIVTELIGNNSSLIDCIEYAIAQYGDMQKNLEHAFDGFAHEQFFFPRKNSIVNIMHYKPNGDIFKLKPGKAIDVVYSTDDGFSVGKQCTSLVLKREFSPQPWHKSFYDGFEGLDIKPGDYSTCHVKENFPVVTNKYFRADGTPIGCYYNISTPVQVFPGEIQYLDLEIDVVENQAGEKKVVDADKLDAAVKDGYISEKTREFALSIVNMVIEGKIKEDLSCEASLG